MSSVQMNNLIEPHPHPGRLIVVEGIDGSGKSTQLSLVHRWLEAEGYRVFFTAWNSSALVQRAIRRGKKKDLLTPTVPPEARWEMPCRIAFSTSGCKNREGTDA